MAKIEILHKRSQDIEGFESCEDSGQEDLAIYLIRLNKNKTAKIELRGELFNKTHLAEGLCFCNLLDSN